MISRAIPYEGKEPYIFLSYCHKDADRVYPLLEQMVRDGYRMWYDDGNHPGDDWLENIAKHLNDCTVCLAMISEQSANSHNCKSEINEAISWNKKLAAVLLENFTMSLGMQLQLSTIHYIKKSEYPVEQLLLKKLYETEGFSVCRAAPGSLPMREIADIPSPTSAVKGNPVSAVNGFIEAERKAGHCIGVNKTGTPAAPECVAPPRQAEIAPTQKIQVRTPCSEKPVGVSPAGICTTPARHSAPVPLSKSVPDPEDDDDAVTVFDGASNPNDTDDCDESETVMAVQQDEAILVRISTGQAYHLASNLSRIGRSSKRCEVVIADNAYIGNCHAEIAYFEGQYVLHDMGSANGTFVNGVRLKADERSLIQNGSIFLLYTEPFILLVGNMAADILDNSTVYYLYNKKTNGFKLVNESPLFLDRGHKWADGTFDDAKVSRSGKHAVITIGSTGTLLEDKGSTNGTWLNGVDIRKMPPQPIKTGDQIKIGDTHLGVGIISL